MQESWEGYGKNWMHFVYKADNLFRSIGVLDENSSVTPAIQNFNNLLQLRMFFASSMQHSKPCHQLSTVSGIIFYFSCIYWFVVRAKWPWNWKALQNELWKGWNLAWYHHFIHIACARKLRWLRQKLDALRVQNGQSLSKYQGFRRKFIFHTGNSKF